jgi:hypothetical protein
MFVRLVEPRRAARPTGPRPQFPAATIADSSRAPGATHGLTRETSEDDHAAVTAGAQHGNMLSAPRYSNQERAGALILRVWLEGSSDPQLRVRMIGRPDLDRDDLDTESASTIEETLDYVRAWLERFSRPGRSDSV